MTVDKARPRYFLGVEKSLTGQAWTERLENSASALAIAQQCELPEIVARVIAGRGVAAGEVKDWLAPTLRNLMPDPGVLRDMEKGADRLANAIMNDETIGIIGDFDVDGICSTSILSEFLDAAGGAYARHIPDRSKDGYGPNAPAIDHLAGQGAKVLVTLDCGIAAHEALAHARAVGLDAIVVDHHQAGEVLPAGHAIINPNRHDDLSGLGMLCAAGVTMILVAATARALRKAGWWSDARPEPDLLQYLDLVALATVCDVVPLTGLNRAYVRQGLKIMAGRGRTGLVALADTARLNRAPDVHALGYVLGPRLNAAGRIGSAMQGVELLTSRGRGRANEIAFQLEEYNRARQEIELGVVNQAVVQAEAAMGKSGNLPVLVVSGKGWHPGVLGLAAARLKERFKVPSFVIGLGAGDELAGGSGRSITGVDLGRAVQAAVKAGIAAKGGGHAMAAGLTIAPGRIGDLRAFLETELAQETALARASQALKIDAALTASGATLSLIESLEKAGPFGARNPSPVFAFPAHRIVYADIAGTDHVRLTIAAGDGSRLKAIAFRVADSELGELLLTERSHPLHFAGRLNINDWGGRRTPQLLVSDVAKVT